MTPHTHWAKASAAAASHILPSSSGMDCCGGGGWNSFIHDSCECVAMPMCVCVWTGQTDGRLLVLVRRCQIGYEWGMGGLEAVVSFLGARLLASSPPGNARLGKRFPGRHAQSNTRVFVRCIYSGKGQACFARDIILFQFDDQALPYMQIC